MSTASVGLFARSRAERLMIEVESKKVTALSASLYYLLRQVRIL